MKFRLKTGFDTFLNKALYSVLGADNDYVGEYHTSKGDAQKEYDGLAVSFENYTELPATVQGLIMRLSDEQIEAGEFTVFLARIQALGFTCERDMSGSLHSLETYKPANIHTVYIHGDLEVPKIANPTIAAVKEWFQEMKNQAVQFDMRYQSAYEMNQGVSDGDVDPETRLTFDQAGFIESEIQLAKAICKRSGWKFHKLYDYHPPVDGMYLEVYPMVNLEHEQTLCTREHDREPDFYDVMVRGETLEHIYFELEDIKPKYIDAVIRAACNRFDCDFEVIEV